MASPAPRTIVMLISLAESCSSSVSPASEAETENAFIASESVSTIATQPRTIGQRIHALLGLAGLEVVLLEVDARRRACARRPPSCTCRAS